MILFCNLVSVYVHKICDNKFGGCKKSFSWLGQKVNQKKSVHIATMPKLQNGLAHGITSHQGKTFQLRSVF